MIIQYSHIKILFISSLFFLLSSCYSKIDNNFQTDNSNSILGHWVIDINRFEKKMNEESLNLPEVISGEKSIEEIQFGVGMVVGMYKNYYIKFTENKFEEYNPMGETSTGTWKIENNQLIRDYDLSGMLKRTLDMMDKWKPNKDDFENEKDFEIEMKNHENEKNDVLKVLHQTAPFTLEKNKLTIKVTSEGPEGRSLIVPFQLNRK